MNNTQPIKFLVVRFSSIGDIILTTPVVRCIHQQVQGSIVHYLTKQQFVPLMEHNPAIAKVYGYDKNWPELMAQLLNEQYDFIIDLHHNLRTSRLISRLKAPAFRFYKLNIAKWLLVNLRINILPGIHIVDRYMETVSIFDVKNDGQGLDYFIPSSDEVDLRTLPAFLHQGFIGIVAGAKHNTKQMPEDKLIDLCIRLNRPVILLGGKEDAERAGQIAAASGSHVFNGCGRFTLHQSASLVRQAKLIITPDTGLMHIAAAFKKNILSVWGNTIPEFGMYPYLPGSGSFVYEVKGLRCRPCSKLGYKKCPRNHFKCMNQIAWDDIIHRSQTLFA